MAVYNSFTGRGRKPPRGLGYSARLRPIPARPPTGYYDPAIDAQVQAGTRGLQDLRIDTGTGHRRGEEDYRSALLGLDTARQRTYQDYTRASSDLGLSFQRLGRQQAEGAASHGVLSGGLAAQAAAIRAANQGREQTQLDTGRDRALQDLSSQQTLLDRDYARQYGAGGDLDLTLTRAEREQPFLESDANAQRLFQATQAGYLPPVPGWIGHRPRRPRVPRGAGYGVG